VGLPSLGRMQEIFPGAWRGVWVEKNAMGGVMAIAFVFMAAAGALNPRRAALWGGFALLALALVLLSTSKTSLVSLLLGFGAFVFVWLIRRGPAMSVAVTWAGIVGIFLMAGVALFAADQVFELLGKDATLTGRTKIWAAAMRQVELRPWTGFGYGTIWGDLNPWSPNAWITKDAGFAAQHAHNSWLEQWLGTGVFGLAAFGLFYLQTLLATVLAVFRSKGAYLAAPFFIVYSLMALTESVAVSYNDLRWVLFVAMAVKLGLGDEAVSSPAAPLRPGSPPRSPGRAPPR
jgi:exopolysaccharide production protein ExoQ